MIRVLYTALELLGTAFAILSPIAVVHWLLGIMNISALNGLLKPLGGFFDPLNKILLSLLPITHFQYQGNDVSIVQAVLGFVLTFCFFVCTAMANFLKSSEQKMDLAREMQRQQQQIAKMEAKRKKEQQQINLNNQVLVLLNYDFGKNPTAGEFFARYAEKGGTALNETADSLLLGFGNLEQAIGYCIEAGKQVLALYATLRPMDPQPPYRLALHAERPGESADFYRQKCAQLIKYTGNNQLIFSMELKALLDAKGLSNSYKFQSIGFYDLSQESSEKNQELFLMLLKKN